jgi:hypothetical protein
MNKKSLEKQIEKLKDEYIPKKDSNILEQNIDEDVIIMTDIEKKEKLSVQARLNLNLLNKSALSITRECPTCPSYNKKDKVCEEKTLPKCSCEKPELLGKYRSFDDIGFCKNCYHFIIRSKDQTWKHYNRPYNCHFPYSSEICGHLDNILEMIISND